MGLIGFDIAQGYIRASMALLGPFWLVGILLCSYDFPCPWGGASSLQASPRTPKGTLFVIMIMWAVIGWVACSRSRSSKHAAGAYVSVWKGECVGQRFA